MRANTCTPRLPEVLAHGVNPSSVINSRSAFAASTTSANPMPGCGSRSIRSSSGLSLSSARTGHGWKVMVFIWMAQMAVAISSITSCGCRRPDG